MGQQQSALLSDSRKPCLQNWSHLPNSRIKAQISRALSTSLHFDPNNFAKGMIDHWDMKVVCGLLVRAVLDREHTAGAKKREGEKEEEEGRARKVSGQLFTTNSSSREWH